MNGEPGRDLRKSVISELERQKKLFFANGNTIKKIPIGHSGLESCNTAKPFSGTGALRFNSQQRLQQARRAKLAPYLRKYANEGKTIQEASRCMKIAIKRAYLVAAENNIIFADRSVE